MAKVRRHVVRMAELRETDILKPIDTIIYKGDNELPGRNESKRIGGPESETPRRSSPQPEGEDCMNNRKLTDAVIHFGGVVTAAW